MHTVMYLDRGYKDTRRYRKGSGQIENTTGRFGDESASEVRSCRSCHVSQAVGGRRRSSIGCVSSTTSGGDATHRHIKY